MKDTAGIAKAPQKAGKAAKNANPCDCCVGCALPLGHPRWCEFRPHPFEGLNYRYHAPL